jgi:dTDP-4-dehydrorhamnose reductase
MPTPKALDQPRRVLIIGGTGMLGHKLVQQLSGAFDVYYTVRRSLEDLDQFGFFDIAKGIGRIDVLQDDDIAKALEISKPDVVINAVGVVKQLPQSEDVVNTLLVNSILPHRLYRFAGQYGYRLVTISTDCVFLGDRGMYAEFDPPDALDLYGRSKNLGELNENACLTIRTSIIGRELSSAHGLIEWFLRNRGATVKGYSRAIYSGFPTIVFADIIADLLQNHPDLHGIYHISSEPINKFELLALANQAYGTNVKVGKDESFTIDRSLRSENFRRRTGFNPDSWENMIARMASDPTPYDKWRT